MLQLPANLEQHVADAVAHYWHTRQAQQQRQMKGKRKDYGARCAVTGGAQLDGFTHLFRSVIQAAGIEEEAVFTRKTLLELPGFFRPTKEWDVVVVKDGKLLAAIEAKSQVGPSFGNNFNNRTEEAMGSALDLWTAYREGAFGIERPFLGYCFMLEDCTASSRPVSVREPHFPVRTEFHGTSYAKRYELFCRKLVLERHFTSAAFLTSCQDSGVSGAFATPAEDLSILGFIRSLCNHLAIHA